MPWDNAFFIGAAALIIIGGAPAILSERPATQKSGRLLWVIAYLRKPSFSQ
jgi:hypothetical protein